MIFDIHIHLFGNEIEKNGNHISARLRNRWVSKVIAKIFKRSSMDPNSASIDDRIKALTLKWIRESSIDKAVVLALDGAHTDSGKLDLKNTGLMTSNDYVSRICRRDDQLLFGASIHPYRKDALSELDKAVKDGATLVKWLPSAQNIDPLDKKCLPFYELMAFHQIPLLSHTGNEHVLSRFDQTLNHPMRLKTALGRKIKVIAAHLGSRMFLHEKCYLDDWIELAASHENLYGDISAFINPVRAYSLNRRLKGFRISRRLLYGSDFPGVNFPISFLFQSGWEKYLKARQCSNPIEQSFMVMKYAGIGMETFHRAERVLMLSPKKETSAV